MTERINGELIGVSEGKGEVKLGNKKRENGAGGIAPWS